MAATDATHTTLRLPEALRRELLEAEQRDVVFSENPERWVLLPVQFPSLFEYYKRAETTFWTPEDFAWQNDAVTWGAHKEVSAALRAFAEGFLFLYSTSDARQVAKGRLAANDSSSPAKPPIEKDDAAAILPDVVEFSCSVLEAIQIPEARAYLGFQIAFENFHREVLAQWMQVLPAVGPVGVSDAIKAKARFLNEHLAGFVGSDVGGDVAVRRMDADSSDSSVCPMAIALAMLAISKLLFLSGGLLRVTEFCETLAPESDVCRSARKLLHDCTLHGDFYCHMYGALDVVLPVPYLRGLMLQAARLELEAAVGIFGATLNSNDYATVLRQLCHRMLQTMGVPSEDVWLAPTSEGPNGFPGSDTVKRSFPMPEPVMLEEGRNFKVPHSLREGGPGGASGSEAGSAALTQQFSLTEDF